MSSPHLMKQMVKAVREEHLDHIHIDQPNSHRGGYYDGQEKAIYIDPDVFKANAYKEEFKRLDVITGILGHETQHSFQAKNSRTAVYDLNYKAEMKIRDVSRLAWRI